MFNPYVIILSLFIIAGVFASLWGWRIIARGRETLAWPKTNGTITQSEPASDADDLLPLIGFSYQVDNKNYQQTHHFPASVTPSPELSKSYLEKYPVGTSLPVHYHPDDPENATIEPGLANGDWFVFALVSLPPFLV